MAASETDTVDEDTTFALATLKIDMSLPTCSSSKPSSSSTCAQTTALSRTARSTRQQPSSANSTS